jgi:hypothetical protein
MIEPVTFEVQQSSLMPQVRINLSPLIPTPQSKRFLWSNVSSVVNQGTLRCLVARFSCLDIWKVASQAPVMAEVNLCMTCCVRAKLDLLA